MRSIRQAYDMLDELTSFEYILHLVRLLSMDYLKRIVYLHKYQADYVK